MKTSSRWAVANRQQDSQEHTCGSRAFFVKVAALALLGVAVVGGMANAAPPLPGAIFTTDSTCTGVNVNIYGDMSKTTADEIEAGKDLVHIDGGPAHIGAAGLPAGSYYVRVTDPSGATLLGTSVGSGNDTPFVVDANGEPLDCYQLSAILIRGSNALPGYDTTPNNGGEYKVWVSTVATFDNDSTKTDNFKVFGAEGGGGGGGGGEDTATLCVDKFYDANANGIHDPTEVFINDWQVKITGAMLDTTELTDVCILVKPGTYAVGESTPIEPHWIHTASLLDGVPQSISASSVTVTLATNSTHEVLFGNVCVGAGGGLTLGFWSNKNGQATMNDGGTMAPELALLSSYNLRNANGSNFDPGSYAGFRTWLLSATATNMSYMLSAQLAAMILNVEAGKVGGGAIVYAPAVGITSPGLVTGFITISDLLAAANTELGLHGLVLAGNADRAYQEALKNALDDANNNKNFVQAAPCPFTFAN